MSDDHNNQNNNMNNQNNNIADLQTNIAVLKNTVEIGFRMTAENIRSLEDKINSKIEPVVDRMNLLKKQRDDEMTIMKGDISHLNGNLKQQSLAHLAALEKKADCADLEKLEKVVESKAAKSPLWEKVGGSILTSSIMLIVTCVAALILKPGLLH